MSKLATKTVCIKTGQSAKSARSKNSPKARRAAATEQSDPNANNPVRTRSEKVSDETLAPSNGEIVSRLLKIRDEVGRIEGRQRKAIYALLSDMLATTQQLLASSSAWVKFCRDPVWKTLPPRWQPSGKQRETQALESVVRVVVGRDPQFADRRTRWKGALQYALDEGVKPCELPGAIKDYQGIGAMYKASRKPSSDQSQRVAAGKLQVLFLNEDAALKLKDLPIDCRVHLWAKITKRRGLITYAELRSAKYPNPPADDGGKPK